MIPPIALIALAAGAAFVVAASSDSGGPTRYQRPWWKSLGNGTTKTPEDAATLAPGLPLTPEELDQYARAVADVSMLGAVAIPGGELGALVTEYKAELYGLNGGQLGQRRIQADPVFRGLAQLIAARLAARRALLPSGAATAGQGPPIVFWAETAPNQNWNWTQTDWFGRHYAGGSMWDNLAAGPGILADGLETAGIEAWKGIKAAAPYLELAASFIPVYGPWIVGAIHLAYTGDLDESTKAAIRAAIPGGPLAQMGADFAFSAIEGEELPKAGLDAFFHQYPEAKLAFDATMAAKSSIENGDAAAAITQSLDAYQHAQNAKGAIGKDFF